MELLLIATPAPCDHFPPCLPIRPYTPSRLAEGYSSELNLVMVTNREAHAELVSILQKLDIVEREKGKAALLERQVGVRVASESVLGLRYVQVVGQGRSLCS